MFLFMLLAVVAVAASIAMITARNSVHSALFLVVVFFCLSVLYLTLNAEFLAVVQIVVYAGAIMVLFLFVITLLNPGREESGDRLRSQRPAAAALGLALLAEIALLLRSGTVRELLGAFPPAKPFADQVTATFEGGPAPTAVGAPDLGNTQALGFELFSTYLLPFEVISIVLLLAVVCAIVLAKRQLR
jgi:NADH-quinone oxidoreductase subunit J